MISHTPGPWSIIADGLLVVGPYEPRPQDDPTQRTASIALCGMRPRSEAESTANALIISAAPDFLAAVCDDPEPSQWRLAWVESFLASLEAIADTDEPDPQTDPQAWYKAVALAGILQAKAHADEDPQAWYEAISESRIMCLRLRAAVAKARGTP